MHLLHIIKHFEYVLHVKSITDKKIFLITFYANEYMLFTLFT